VSSDDFFSYNVPAFCFLERAQSLLDRFDKGEVECLFYAALELRMGIESRLFEYIRSALKTAKQPPERIKEYSATKLLKRLARINPETQHTVAVGIRVAGGSVDGILNYTPVTPILASYHGKLGEVLHFNFFENNPEWFYKVRPEPPIESKTLYSYRDFLITVSEELERATSGALLSPPVWFLPQMDQLNAEE
jgi:hypothetical protein